MKAWAVLALLSATSAFAQPPGESPGAEMAESFAGRREPQFCGEGQRRQRDEQSEERRCPKGQPSSTAALKDSQPDLSAPAPPTASPWIDAPLTLGLFGGWAGLHALQPDMVDPMCPCTRDQVNAFDRIAVGDHFKGAETTADVLAISTLGLALAAPLLTAEDGSDWSNDATLILQSMALAGVLTELSKMAMGRPYPYMYNPAPFPEQNDDGVNYASFWSGHTAVPMAAAVATARLIDARAPHSKWRWVAWIAGPSLAVGSGVWQIVAHNHFPTDVLAGAGVGLGVGLFVPWVHTF